MGLPGRTVIRRLGCPACAPVTSKAIASGTRFPRTVRAARRASASYAITLGISSMTSFVRYRRSTSWAPSTSIKRRSDVMPKARDRRSTTFLAPRTSSTHVRAAWSTKNSLWRREALAYGCESRSIHPMSNRGISQGVSPSAGKGCHHAALRGEALYRSETQVSGGPWTGRSCEGGGCACGAHSPISPRQPSRRRTQVPNPTGWLAELCLFSLGLVALGHVYRKVGLGVGIVVHLTNRIHCQNATWRGFRG